MKKYVICIDDNHGRWNELIIGKIYEIESEDETLYHLKNVSGGIYKYRFKEYNYRNQKLNRIL
jgi:hypothetical protein